MRKPEHLLTMRTRLRANVQPPGRSVISFGFGSSFGNLRPWGSPGTRQEGAPRFLVFYILLLLANLQFSPPKGWEMPEAAQHGDVRVLNAANSKFPIQKQKNKCLPSSSAGGTAISSQENTPVASSELPPPTYISTARPQKRGGAAIGRCSRLPMRHHRPRGAARRKRRFWSR